VSLPLKRLEVLSLENCRKMTAQGVFLFVQMAPKLRELNINTKKSFGEELMKSVNPKIHMKYLTSISLRCRVTGAAQLTRKYPNLTKITLTNVHLESQLVY
jgi:hypothetical protein